MKNFLRSMCCMLVLASCQQVLHNPQIDESTIPPLTDREKSLIRLGRSIEKGGDIDGAIRMYEEAIDVSSGRVDAYLALSRLYEEQGKYQQSIEKLKTAAALQPFNEDVANRLGKILLARKKPQAAIHAVEKTLLLKPDAIDLLNTKGVALDSLGRHSEAQESYITALNQDTDEKDFLYNNLALSYILDEKYDSAIAMLLEVEGIEENDRMRQNLALAYGLNGDMDRARQWGGKDLTPEELESNLRFYQSYRSNRLIMDIKPVPELKPKAPERPAISEE